MISIFSTLILMEDDMLSRPVEILNHCIQNNGVARVLKLSYGSYLNFHTLQYNIGETVFDIWRCSDKML